MFFRREWFALFLSLYLVQNDAYRILGLFPFEGRSHFIMFEALCKSLAKRGHQVDVVSHFPLKTPVENYRDVVDLRGTRSTGDGSFSVEFAQLINNDVVRYVAEEDGNDICKLLGHEKMQNFLKTLHEKSSYDVVITEVFGHDCMYAFGHFLNVPVIGVSSSYEFIWVDQYMGNPLNLASTTHSTFPNPESFDFLRFWDRLSNTVDAFYKMYHFFKITKSQTDIVKEHFGPDVPDISELRKSLSLLLLNTHHSLFGVRPQLPNIIEVGGIHVEANEDKITPELQKWMDESADGVVYFSMGSMIAIETMPPKTLDGILSSFAKLAPVKVLMKVGKENRIDAKKLPSNVKILNWISQVPVLRHNNTRAFITHGGLMGSLEAIYHKVPMIGIPLFGDQKKNVYMYAAKNLMIPLPYDQLEEKSLDDALNAILRDPKYKNAAIETSNKFRDRPSSAVDTAVFWVEYVIRNGADSLKSPTTELYWWQVMLLDVYTFFLVILGVVIWTIIRMLKSGFRRRPKSPKKRE